MHSTSRCACLMFTWCPRQGWKLHPRAATGGGRHSPAPPQPHGYKSHTILPPPHIPTALGTVLHPSSAPHPSPITPAPHGTLPTSLRSWEFASCSPCLCCSLSRLLATFSTQNFPVINIPAPWQETCFSYASPLLLREPFPAARAPCASPPLFLPAPPRYFRHVAKSAAAQRP